MTNSYDVAIVGAGPAGLAAASLCARTGLSTVLLDAAASPGGAIYRALTRTPVKDRAILGADYWVGEKLVREFLSSGVAYVPGARVERVTGEFEIAFTLEGEARQVQARRVILAPGAVERPFVIPGGTLAGVGTLGAAQAVLQESGVVPPGRIVIAGTDPLLWVMARQLLDAGARVDAILDTTVAANRKHARRHLIAYLRSPYFFPNLKLWRAVRRKAPVIRHVTRLRAEGEGRLQRIAYGIGESDPAIHIEADVLLLHHGVVPDTALAMAAGVPHEWDELHACFTPLVDPLGATRIGGLSIAGDAAGIAGGQSAAWRGVMTAANIVFELKPSVALPAGKLARSALAGFARGRRYLDILHRPSKAFRDPVGAAPSEITDEYAKNNGNHR